MIWDPKHIDIKGPQDLRGKKYGNFQVADWKAEFKQFLETGGMTEKDVTVVNPGYSTPTFITAGKIDAGDGLAYGERVTLSLLTNEEIPFLSYTDFGTPDYPWGQFVVTEDYANKNGDVLKAFLRATAKSIKKYLTDTPSSQKAFQECCVSGPTATGTMASTTAKFTASIPFWFEKGQTADTASYFVNDDAAWAAILKWAPGIGLAPADQIEAASTYYTNEFITPEAQNPTV
jgi:putative hydroxymethylpyrimidine transport system substrate-binding protein